MSNGLTVTRFDFSGMLVELGKSSRPDWCGICGDGLRHQSKEDRESTEWDLSCRICGELSAPSHTLCPSHQISAEDALKPQLPELYARLEGEYGPEVDGFIQRGRLRNVLWWIRDVGAITKQWADDAFDLQMQNDREFDLRLIKRGRAQNHVDDKNWGQDYWRLWSEADRDYFVEHLATYLERAVAVAIKNLPTDGVERQLVDALTGNTSAISGDDVQDGAIEFITGFLPSSTGLSKGADDLIGVRYKPEYRVYDWHGWDDLPSTWNFAPDLIPSWLQPLRSKLRRHQRPSSGAESSGPGAGTDGE